MLLPIFKVHTFKSSKIYIYAQPCLVGSFVFLYLAIIYYHFTIMVAMCRINQTSLVKETLLCTLSVLFSINILYAFGKSSLTDPGYCQDRISTVSDIELDNSLEQGGRVCLHCQVLKSPNTHHCKVCNRCINNMDHHCPWISNCVGRQNRGYFLSFLQWLLFGLIYSSLQNFHFWMSITNKHELYNQVENLFCVTVGISIVLFAFSLWSWTIFLNGQTTVSYLVKNNQTPYGNNYIHRLKLTFGSNYIMALNISPIFIRPPVQKFGL